VSADPLEAPSSSVRGASSQVRPVIHPGQLMPLVHERLTKALGRVRASEVLHQALGAFGDRPLDTPQDLMKLADLLIQNSGLVQVVGRSLKVQAILRGATEHA
jgi:hypothetical protein